MGIRRPFGAGILTREHGPGEVSMLRSSHLSLKFTKWGPKKSEDCANGDRVLFKYCILFQVWHGKAMPYQIVRNNISGTHGNLKGSKLVNLSVIVF